MSSQVVFAQTLQELLVVNETVQRPQNEDREGNVTNFLQLKVPAETLQLAGRPACLFQLQQNFRLFVQVCCQGLDRDKKWRIRSLLITDKYKFDIKRYLTFKPWRFFNITSPMRW